MNLFFEEDLMVWTVVLFAIDLDIDILNNHEYFYRNIQNHLEKEYLRAFNIFFK